jgi:cation diffusion facilitator CzcD-associated flavoprotein CzcO
MERNPHVMTSPRIAIIGAGMSGILTAIKLSEAGYDNHVLYEKAARLGGTWRENTYPGIACDVPAHLYTYSFEPNADWSQAFATGAEIQAYFEGVASKYRVPERIRFNEGVDVCEFGDGRWHLRTSTGREDVADVVIAATGVLHNPRVAELPGLASFEGACFHSARWDHSVSLDDKRVGVIGTGSTAIQITSALAGKVANFELFQRTPQWIMPIENPTFSDSDKAGFRRDPSRLAAVKAEADAAFQNFSNAVIDADSNEIHEIEAACMMNLEKNVRDAALREKLRPGYRAGCKRLIFSTNFYEALQRPNTHLVTEGIERIEARGVRTRDGQLHELDVLVMATGFVADSFIRPAIVLGKNGKSLDEAWADRPVAYLSVSVPEFPNFFLLNGPNGPVGNFSLIQIAEHQVAYVLQLLDEIRSGRCRAISASHDATARFEAERVVAARQSIWATGCKSWYLDKDGVPASWPWSRERFFEAMARPALEAFERVP